MHEQEIQILKQAIINEHEGKQFYLLAAEKAEDSDVQEIFRSLAVEEQHHEKWLRNALSGLVGKKQEKPDDNDNTSPASPGIFEPEKLKNAGSIVVSALHIGVMMEKESIDFYQNASGKAEIAEIRALCLKLADWEGEHLDKLQKAYDFAKEEWWSKQGFSPA